MKKLLLALVIVFYAQADISAHPLHLSIININIVGKDISVTISTFVDDWETAYFHYHSKPVDLTVSDNYNGSWLKLSLKDAFRIMENEDSDPLSLTSGKVTFDDLSMTIEMHGKLNKAPKSLYLYNSMLTDIFPDQTNLVIISLDGKETGMKFDYKTKQKELKLR